MATNEEKLEELARWSSQMMAEYGWYAHFVKGERNYPCGTNFHTHGLEESFKHPDLQICLNIETPLAQQLFNMIVGQIKEGMRFKAGYEYEGIITGYAIGFASARQGGRKILRALIPDQHGKYLEPFYNEQLTLLSDGIPLQAMQYARTDIRNHQDVRDFFVALVSDHQLSFHPDTRFQDYYDTRKKQRVFDPKQAAKLNRLMNHCFEICGRTDIYAIAIKAMDDTRIGRRRTQERLSGRRRGRQQ